MRKTVLAGALVLVALSGVAGLARVSAATRAGASSAPNVTMKVQAGYQFQGGGNYRLNGPTILHTGDVWVPIHITLRNLGGSDVSGKLVIADPGSQTQNGGPVPANYGLDVTLPSGGRKLVEMYVRASDLGNQLAVSFMAHGALVASGSTLANAQPQGILSVGVLSDDTATRPLLHSLTLGDTTLSVAQFDDVAPVDTQPQALQNFDLIVITNYSSDALSAQQAAALRSWVQSGGTLLVAGGLNARKTMGHLPGSLLAATLRSASTTTQVAAGLPELARLGGDSSGGAAEYSVATPQPGATVLLRHQGVPLLVDQTIGRGHLVYSALEPTQAPFNAWPVKDQGRFWWQALGQALAAPVDTLAQDTAQDNNGNNSFNTGLNGSGTSITSDISTLPARSLPSLQIYALLIVLYILVLGPGNFGLLRWLRRVELSWLSIPAIAIVFGVASFGLAYARNGGSVLANVDTIVYMDPGSATKLADSYIGIFAPYPGDYTISSPAPALAWAMSSDANGGSSGGTRAPDLDEGPQFNASLYGLQMWTMRTIGTRQQVNLPGQISAHLVLHGNTVSGDVTNNSKITLYDGAIVSANAASSPIAVLAPGQTVTIAPFQLSGLPNSVLGGNNVGPLANIYASLVEGGPGGHYAAGPRSLAGPGRYTNVLTALFPSGTVATAAAPLDFIGWSATALSTLTVNGAAPRRSDLDLFVAPLTLAGTPGQISVAPGALPVGVIGTSVAPSANAGNGLLLSSSDHVDVQLTLPNAGHGLTVQTVAVAVDAGSGSSLTPTSAELWNWRTGRWVPIDASTGSASRTHAAAFASPDGRIRLRVQAPSAGSLSFGDVSQNIQIGATARVST